MKEGSLEAPNRQPLDWQDPDFYDTDSLYEELERVFDICASRQGAQVRVERHQMA